MSVLVFGGLGLLFTSCASSSGGVGGEPAPAPYVADVSGGMTAQASQQSAIRKARPGLATGWGKEVNAPMSYTGFTRSKDRPYGGVAMMRYNDQEGVEAMGIKNKRYSPSMQHAANGLVSWGVKSRGHLLKSRYWKGGRMVVGKKGKNYSIVVKNNSRSRLETVLSVDGLDVIDGKPASTKKRGYIVHPGKTMEVKGFRTSQDAVASFKFSSVNPSYANLRHGDTRNVGVMGLAVFTEKGVDPWGRNLQEIQSRGDANPFADAPMYRATH